MSIVHIGIYLAYNLISLNIYIFEYFDMCEGIYIQINSVFENNLNISLKICVVFFFK